MQVTTTRFLSLLFVMFYVPGVIAASEMPSLAGGTWFNSPPLKTEELRNEVVLVYFWTFGCHNCKAVEPYVKQWHQRYQDKGLHIIAIHSPEFDHERDPDNVRQYLARNDITYPVLLDNDFVNWRRYTNRYWPTIYLVDRMGQVRYRKIGEGSYRQTEEWIQRLLAETVSN